MPSRYSALAPEGNSSPAEVEGRLQEPALVQTAKTQRELVFLGLGASVTILIASSVSIMPRSRSHFAVVLAESFSMMTEPMGLTAAAAGAARRMTMAGMWSPNGYDHEQSGATRD